MARETWHRGSGTCICPWLDDNALDPLDLNRAEHPHPRPMQACLHTPSEDSFREQPLTGINPKARPSDVREYISASRKWATRRQRYWNGAYLQGEHDSHIVLLHLSKPAWLECRLAGSRLLHQARPGTVGVCPAGANCVGKSLADLETLIVAVKPSAFALAASEDAAPGGDVIKRLAGEDAELSALGRRLSRECIDGYPNGPLYWHELAARFIGRILARHTTLKPTASRGASSKEMLARLRDYIEAHLDEQST